MTSSQSRFEAVSRRAFITRTLAVGAVVAVPGLACSNNDKNTFSTPSTTATTTRATTATATAATSATSDASTRPSVGSTTGGGTAATFSASGKLAIAFTFAASGGQVHNPYIAVWIEDSKGELVKTVSLWYNSRDGKYLNELQRWASVETSFQSAGGTDSYDTVSGATRVAGTYSVMWDGTDTNGARVALGDYFVCIEAARERGPYELIRGAVKRLPD